MNRRRFGQNLRPSTRPSCWLSIARNQELRTCVIPQKRIYHLSFRILLGNLNDRAPSAPDEFGRRRGMTRDYFRRSDRARQASNRRLYRRLKPICQCSLCTRSRTPPKVYAPIRYEGWLGSSGNNSSLSTNSSRVLAGVIARQKVQRRFGPDSCSGVVSSSCLCLRPQISEVAPVPIPQFPA